MPFLASGTYVGTDISPTMPARVRFETQPDERWREVRNVVTSPDLFTEVARLAGWTVTAWHPGSGPAGTMPDGTRVGLGQSIVVMRPTAP